MYHIINKIYFLNLFRAFLNMAFNGDEATACSLLSLHNVAFQVHVTRLLKKFYSKIRIKFQSKLKLKIIFLDEVNATNP